MTARVRELRLLRMGTTDGPPREMQELATAAYVTACGQQVLDDTAPNYRPFVVAAADPAPTQVRIIDVGLLDGSTRLLWEGTPERAEQEFAALGRPLVPTVTDGGLAVPSRACSGCKVRPVCEALPDRPGLLGLPDHGTHPRVLAPSRLWTYRTCPTKYLLTTDIRLPAEYRVNSPSVMRGLRVHDWLQQAHSRGVACTLDDLPDADGHLGEDAAMLAEAARLDPADLADIAPFLAQHLSSCPWTQRDDLDDSLPEHDVAVHDSDADVLVTTRPDLLLATPAGPVWRETKTLVQQPADDSDLLAAYPQVALAVCVLADRGLTEPRLAAACQVAAGTVELELLTASSARVVRWDAGDEPTVLAARRALAEATYGWHRDDEFAAIPGTACQFCEVARWCPDAHAEPVGATADFDGVTVDTQTGEVLAGNQPPMARGLSLVESVLGAAAPPRVGDDVPF